MRILHFAQLEAQRAAESRSWLEFLRVPSLSMGVYHLKAGQTDLQKPHSEDEVYYVLSGSGRFACEGEVREVSAGSVIYVERHVEHRFVDITEDLTALVFFAPAEGSLAGGGA
jgi:quercetin dioxygenase-like cupin family protein